MHFGFNSVPFLATAVQEELETGSAAAAAAACSDACSARSTVKQQSSGLFSVSLCI